jgi:hypothetical protein
MRFRSFGWVLPLVCIACSCHNTGDRQDSLAAAPRTRIIIGFDETVQTPGAELLAQLGATLGCQLQPVQAIGGNAFVYNCVASDDEASLIRRLDGLGQHKGVRYAEIDRKRKIQN